MYSFKLCYYFKFIRVKSFTKFASICYPVCFTVFQYSITNTDKKQTNKKFQKNEHVFMFELFMNCVLFIA